jgi:hypothetical protein
MVGLTDVDVTGSILDGREERQRRDDLLPSVSGVAIASIVRAE